MEPAKVVIARRRLHHPTKGAALVVQEVQRNFVILLLVGRRGEVHVGCARFALGGRGWDGAAGPKASREAGRAARRRARQDDAEGAVCGKGSPKLGGG